jgi:hypothetical protein
VHPQNTTPGGEALPPDLNAFGERTSEIVGLLMACQLEASAPWVWVHTDGIVPDDAVALTLHVQGCYVEPDGQPRLWFMFAPIDDAEIVPQWRGWQLGWFGCAGQIVLHADDGPHTFTAPDPPGDDLPRLSLWRATGEGVSFVPRRMYATYGPAPHVAAERHWWPGIAKGMAAYLHVSEHQPSQQDYARAWTGLDLLVLLPGMSPRVGRRFREREAARRKLREAVDKLGPFADRFDVHEKITGPELARAEIKTERTIEHWKQRAEWDIDDVRVDAANRHLSQPP